MSDHETQVCPWCQTEIVWDPEIGPEEVCPHCLNELGDYRSVSLKVEELDPDADDEADEEDEEDHDSHGHDHGHDHGHHDHGHHDHSHHDHGRHDLHDHDDHHHDHHQHTMDETDEESDYYDDEDAPDPYREKAQEIIDAQLEAPECPNCRELMLFGGQVRLSGNRFDPAQPAAVGQPILSEILEMDLYVCPSCFKTETYLAEPGRLRLNQTLND